MESSCPTLEGLLFLSVKAVTFSGGCYMTETLTNHIKLGKREESKRKMFPFSQESLLVTLCMQQLRYEKLVYCFLKKNAKWRNRIHSLEKEKLLVDENLATKSPLHQELLLQY